MVSSSSSTNTPTASAPYGFATLDISFASDSWTDRLELGQRIIPISLAPAFAANSASLADVMPHILTMGSFLSASSALDVNETEALAGLLDEYCTLTSGNLGRRPKQKMNVRIERGR